MLSRAELDVRSDRGAILAVIGSARTRANLQRDGRAGLVAIDGVVAHYVKLRVVRTLEELSVVGCGLEVVEHKRDTLGIPLAPIRFHTTEEIARLESWPVSARILRTLGAAPGSAE